MHSPHVALIRQHFTTHHLDCVGTAVEKELTAQGPAMGEYVKEVKAGVFPDEHTCCYRMMEDEQEKFPDLIAKKWRRSPKAIFSKP